MYTAPPPTYQHYQPPPQPLQMPAATGGSSYGLAPPVPPSSDNPSSAIGQPLQGAKQAGMGVGTTAGDFELFGPTMTGPKPFPNASTARQQQQQQQRIPIPSSGSSSESSSMADGDYPPVPELVADSDAPSPRSFSPPSPKFTVSPVRPGLLPHPNRGNGSSSHRSSSSYRGSYRSERASSVPAPECPRPMRRKTQESRDWPSFYSSASSSSSSSMSSLTGAPTPQLGESKPLLVVDEPASFVTPTAASAASANPFDVSSFALSPAQPFYSAFSPPYTDHPLLPSEQTDLLDRVRRDLLDVDLSSIKGPLRALALSSSNGAGVPDYYDRETTPTQQLFSPPRNHLLRSPATTASDATVSPQEAFLDYDQVDSRLHGSSSLFASMAPEINTPALSQSTAQLTLSPPGTAPSPVAAAPTSPRLPTHASTNSGMHGHHPRRPHPFSVPQNAVTWAEKRSKSGHRVVGSVLVGGDAADNDGDFAGEDDVEEEEEGDDEQDASDNPVKEEDVAVPVTRPGFAAPRPAVASDPDDLSAAFKPEDDAREDVKPFLVGSTPLPPTTMSFNPLLPLEAVTSSIRGGFPGFAPPPPPVTATGAPSTSAGQSAFQQELARQRGTASPAASATGTGTATPRRAAAATALTGLHDIAAMYNGPVTTPSEAGLEAAPPSARRPQRNRKRSRIAMSEDDDHDDDAAGSVPAQQPRPDFAAAPPPPPSAAPVAVTQDRSARTSPEPEPESDASYHSSGSSFGGGPRRQSGASAPPNKRRRRAQGSAGSSAASGTGSIVCNHLNSDGSTCGVIFRRPYDLARHKETIHGEGLKGEKVKAKEWKCAECGGTFSRKDALLRHGRIRGHSTG